MRSAAKEEGNDGKKFNTSRTFFGNFGKEGAEKDGTARAFNEHKGGWLSATMVRSVSTCLDEVGLQSINVP